MPSPGGPPRSLGSGVLSLRNQQRERGGASGQGNVGQAEWTPGRKLYSSDLHSPDIGLITQAGWKRSPGIGTGRSAPAGRRTRVRACGPDGPDARGVLGRAAADPQQKRFQNRVSSPEHRHALNLCVEVMPKSCLCAAQLTRSPSGLSPPGRNLEAAKTPRTRLNFEPRLRTRRNPLPPGRRRTGKTARNH